MGDFLAHKHMDAVDVHKRKLILKTGYCMRVMLVNKNGYMSNPKPAYFYVSLLSCFCVLLSNLRTSCFALLGRHDAVALRVVVSF